jgi:hypothetical protein
MHPWRSRPGGTRCPQRVGKKPLRLRRPIILRLRRCHLPSSSGEADPPFAPSLTAFAIASSQRDASLKSKELASYLASSRLLFTFLTYYRYDVRDADTASVAAEASESASALVLASP